MKGGEGGLMGGYLEVIWNSVPRLATKGIHIEVDSRPLSSGSSLTHAFHLSLRDLGSVTSSHPISCFHISWMMTLSLVVNRILKPNGSYWSARNLSLKVSLRLSIGQSLKPSESPRQRARAQFASIWPPRVNAQPPLAHYLPTAWDWNLVPGVVIDWVIVGFAGRLPTSWHSLSSYSCATTLFLESWVSSSMLCMAVRDPLSCVSLSLLRLFSSCLNWWLLFALLFMLLEQFPALFSSSPDLSAAWLMMMVIIVWRHRSASRIAIASKIVSGCSSNWSHSFFTWGHFTSFNILTWNFSGALVYLQPS